MPDYLDKFIGADNEMSEVELTVYKRLFTTEDGQFGLGKILERCKFMEPCENERDMALNNFAKELMATIYWDRNAKRVNIHRIIRFVKGMFKRTK